MNHPFIQRHVSLAGKNWFRTGGGAEYYAEPRDNNQFAEVITFAQNNHLPITLLGEGANVLINDKGIAGLTIHPQNTHIEIVEESAEHALVKAGAGASFKHLINFCFDYTLLGLHEFSGIPGTVGGAVYINIHYFEFLLSQFLVTATVINKNDGSSITVDNQWFNFDYDYSTLHQQQYYLLDATFKVKKSSAHETAYARGRSDEMIRYRSRRYPTSGTCGSFFRNFFDNEVSLISNGKKMIYVAYYLDKLGIKGELSHGGAQVSYQHANMIINKGNATSDDIISLAKSMQELVYKNFGIIPQPECQFLGFSSYPLLPTNANDFQACPQNHPAHL